MDAVTFDTNPRATVLDPSRVHFHPALMQDAWIQLKAARGQTVKHIHMLAPAHLIRPEGAVPDVAGEAETAEAIRRRCVGRATARLAQLQAGTPD